MIRLWPRAVASLIAAIVDEIRLTRRIRAARRAATPLVDDDRFPWLW